ncbi:MAG: NifB/NifX family molybdenum-iron cluster-binding protein [Planctomycetota bacterium]
MRVALPVCRGRISPLFDTARSVWLVDVEVGRVTPVRTLPLPATAPEAQVRALQEAEADAVVCGAMSEVALHRLIAAHIRVWPGVAGDVDSIVAALALPGGLDKSFCMPGLGAAGPLGCHLSRRWGWYSATSGRRRRECRGVRNLMTTTERRQED